ncbi:MAG: hypothetical protein A2015_03000 [Spirochaetes bacterium GWF1_31_7]|nr:MAG: hypothetical protein A2Y29_01605 [Spirochaetes bacterium GWE2_31_10]OHD49209.1 MAG: hypothetical protein A2015_03000 [Spirochaetes bacterium GWF1_31_7]HBD95699.1 hypothetical protein [Spirochaetia bacterium]HBI37039.1 hypothetical protein [Spirochaetia bacterium]
MKRNYNHTSDNESETLSKSELKNIIPEIEPVKKKPTWMLKPDEKGGYFKIRYDEATYLKNIKNKWKVE